MTSSDHNLLIKLAALSVVGLVLWRVSKPFRDGLASAKESLDSVTKVAGGSLADVTSSMNGNFQPQYTSASFFLNAKYVEHDLTVNRSWKNTMKDAHEGIERLFDEILDPKGRLKLQYQYLIGGEVSAQTVYGD